MPLHRPTRRSGYPASSSLGTSARADAFGCYRKLEDRPMNSRIPVICATCVWLAVNAAVAAPPPPPKTIPPSSNPEDPHTATKGGADKSVYHGVKKADDSAGCSTPTDAASAGVEKPSPSTRSNGKKTVCTTSGAEGVGAIEKNKPDESKQKSASAPRSTSEKPR